MRALFYTDIHISGQNPRNRIDDYPRAILRKLRETYQIARTKKCDMVLFGGDFFDTHKIYSYDIISEAIEIISESPVPTYCIIGQHDLRGYNPNTYNQSAFGFVQKHCPNFIVVWERMELEDCVLYPCHVWDEFDEVVRMDIKETKPTIMMAHHLLSKDIHMFDIIKTSTIGKNAFDIILSGDLHTGYEPHTIDGTLYANPGSLCRKTKADKDRDPQVLLFEVLNGKKRSKIIKLKSAEPSAEVFRTSIIDELYEKPEFDITGFAENVNKLESESVDIFDIIVNSSKKSSVRKEVIEYIMTKRDDI